MDLDDVRKDLLVASTVAVCTVGLALAIRFGPFDDPGVFGRLVPLGVYLAYLFTRKGSPYTRFDTTRNWILVTLIVTVAIAAYATVV